MYIIARLSFMGSYNILYKHGVLFQSQLTMRAVTREFYKDHEYSLFF